MTPLACVFFQLDKLSTAFETLLVNPSPTAKKTLLESRSVSEGRMLSDYVKRAYGDIAQKTGKKAEEAQEALTEFREELERVVGRVVSLLPHNDNVSLFITESRMIISVMVTAIEECRALLQECRESLLNAINKQAFDPEIFDSNLPSDEEYEFVEEKWMMLEDLLFGLSVDWNLLEGRMEFPHSNELWATPSQRAQQNAVVLRGVSKNPPSPKISFWQKTQTGGVGMATGERTGSVSRTAMDARPLSLHIDSPPSASPFPSPSSSFLPPPMPGAHEFAVKPPPLPRKSAVSTTPPVDPLTLDTTVEPRRQSHPISSPTILNSPSLASSRPAPLSPASSRRVSTISAKSSSLSRSSSKRGSTGFSKRLSALSMTGIMTRKDDESLITPTVSMNLPSSSSATTILSSSTPPPPLRNSTTVSGSTSTSSPAPHPSHPSKPRRPTSTKIKIRDFAYPSVDNRYRGLGIDVPKPNQFSRLNKKLGGSKKARPSSKRWSDGSDDEKKTKTKTIMKRKKKKEKEKKKKKEEEGRNNNGWDESDNEEEEDEEEDDTSTSTDEDEDEDEDEEEEEEEEEEYEEPGWFKKGMGRLSWSFGFSGFKKQFSDDLDTPTSNNNTNNNSYPSRGEMEMNFSGTPTTTTTNEDQTPSSTTSEDDEQQQSQEEEEEEEPPLYPGLYRALYPFEPEGTAEMRLKEDQVVRVVGRGGGVGWAVVVVPEDAEGGVVVVMDNEGMRHALVPESYLEVVQLD
ncbi:hypothetical protein AGABI1DRAFT_109667 [Agaricus bisporus var. burnettii JB137-S8]|uniref:SH3 domain-containing protein n=1 Tax=Agaricus bisporus var. burnettii (strain JB137-S8 / ATCC MYA-4627 / FGSC 10392) TaxID=597362 RepID=K5WWC2_AGABU|nr:uncharacterized protein AGABI1DRAFT_109667 [Agaricus bisporus var. burnettii JB137-S8]EKM75068.1 hypothetical protein AGABI1DRAFT_109667 [Agaricus bisporus var. burnettii JB137-S8]